MWLCLGTVQFGMDYGIIGQKKPSVEDSVECLDYATQNGIGAIDTATAYGTAEEVTGIFLRKKTISRDKLFISSKMLPNVLDDYKSDQYVPKIREHLLNSLKVLGTDYLDAYMLHSARYAYRPDILEALYEVKKEGLTKKVGVSVYEPDEAKACFASPYVDFIQLPYSVFDHRMKDAGVFDPVASDGVEIHTRSAFIQGLILLDEDQVPPYLEKAKPIVTKIKKICEENGMSRVALALAYVKMENVPTHLVFGVDNLDQLKQDIELFQQEIPADLLKNMESEFAGIEAEVVMPSLWKR